MYPKQFIRFFKDQETSFLGAALKRLPVELGFSTPLILCNNGHRFLVKEELEQLGIQAKAVILEPVARNTAPAIAVAALAALRESPDAVIAVMPSDHVIKDQAAFAEAVERAASIAATGKLVLFGIVPKSPHTGYGYIRRGVPLNGKANGACRVEAFVEKPDRKTAEKYVAEGKYFWNSGIFVLHASTLIKELDAFSPQIVRAATAALQGAKEDLGFLRLAKEAFAEAPNISIDYAVMEKTNAAVMLPVDPGWSDVGSWSSLWEIAPRDGHGNHVHGTGILEDTEDCFIHSERSLVATIGIENLVIVNTPDALLVADKSRAQDVSRIVCRLQQTNRKEHEQHIRNFRPWGYFETLNVASRFQVKLLHVKPGGKLSMQMHHHRSEHWIVVQGTAHVVIGEKEQLVRENESVYITATQWHRLENPGKVPLELIEVQIGTYLGEDDIIRAEDVYNRSPDETK
jgi:mannose-1-phosphate guanylyltransferase/mannose-6-phosphate isomerase